MATRTLFQGGIVLTMDDELGELTGDVLVENGRIVEVAERIDPAGADVVDISGSILLPGLIDSHVHLWQSALRGLASPHWGREYFGVVHPLSGRLRVNDMYVSTLGGSVEMLLSGTTTAFDFCHATNSEDHARASLRGLEDSRIRGIFGFCFRHRPEAQIEGFSSLEEREVVLGALVEEWRDHDRVSLGVAMNNIDHVEPEIHAAELAVARRYGLYSSVHSNLPGQISGSASQRLLGDDLIWVHAGPATDEELELLRTQGGSISVTPEVEPAMMGVTPVATRARIADVAVGIGTDVPSGINGSLFAQMRIARAVTRLVGQQAELAAGGTGARTPTSPYFDSYGLLRLATIDGARVVGLADEIGSITPGKRADLLVVSTEPFGLAAGTAADFLVLQATARQLTSVYVGGERVVHEGTHVSADMAALRADLDDTRDWVLGTHPDSHWPELDDHMRARYEAGQGKAQIS